jgi:hypothetical protein
MKYGLVIYKETSNIGDDIQSYAAMRFLPRIDYLIDRERLDLFTPNDKEQVAAIMNGWYMHNKYNWPPSPYIYPLYLSIHFTMRDYMQIGQDFLQGLGKEYLKKYEPIGCRDDSTMKVLQNIGIASYLSGCMTLTLTKEYGICKSSNNYICLVDVDKEIVEKVKDQAGNTEIKIISHNVDCSYTKLSWDERIKHVRELLNTYQNAKCVITSRLHCALPCLAIETPVLLIQNSENDDRFSNFIDFLHHCTESELLEGSYQYDFNNPLMNNNKHLEMRKFIENRCKEFVDSVSNIEIVDKDIPDLKIFKEIWVDKALWQKQLIMNKSNDYLRHMDEYVNYINELTEGKKWTENQYINERKANEELRKYILEMEEGKKWILNQHTREKEINEELRKYISEIEEGKEWIVNQHTREKEINEELRKYISEIEKGKIYIENQLNNSKTEIDNLQNEAEIMKNSISKLTYKYNKIYQDPIINKIIKWKKYDI